MMFSAKRLTFDLIKSEFLYLKLVLFSGQRCMRRNKIDLIKFRQIPYVKMFIKCIKYAAIEYSYELCIRSVYLRFTFISAILFMNIS